MTELSSICETESKSNCLLESFHREDQHTAIFHMADCPELPHRMFDFKACWTMHNNKFIPRIKTFWWHVSARSLDRYTQHQAYEVHNRAWGWFVFVACEWGQGAAQHGSGHSYCFREGFAWWSRTAMHAAIESFVNSQLWHTKEGGHKRGAACRDQTRYAQDAGQHR